MPPERGQADDQRHEEEQDQPTAVRERREIKMCTHAGQFGVKRADMVTDTPVVLSRNVPK